MRILFTAFPYSIHAARWINQLAGESWDLHFFPSQDFNVTHQDLRNVVVHHSSATPLRGLHFPGKVLAFAARRALRWYLPHYRASQLARLITKLRPDVLHSMEFQHAGYLTLEAKRLVRDRFPLWIATNWGSDIYIFGKLAGHQERIRSILAECDYYSCECRRDVILAQPLGLRGKVLPVFPNAGGFDLEEALALRSPEPPSKRRLIMLKGVQNWVGRALVGLRALERCRDLLAGYEIAIYSANDDVKLAAELFTHRTAVETIIIPSETPHREILSYHGRARVSIGLSVGDAISTSFLEAMLMGAFPIQSNTSCANEWAEDGRTALFVPPEDPEVVEAALRLALTDDALVDGAADRNWKTSQARLEYKAIQVQVVDMYRRIVAERGVASHA